MRYIVSFEIANPAMDSNQMQRAVRTLAEIIEAATKPYSEFFTLVPESLALTETQ